MYVFREAGWVLVRLIVVSGWCWFLFPPEGVAPLWRDEGELVLSGAAFRQAWTLFVNWRATCAVEPYSWECKGCRNLLNLCEGRLKLVSNCWELLSLRDLILGGWLGLLLIGLRRGLVASLFCLLGVSSVVASPSQAVRDGGSVSTSA